MAANFALDPQLRALYTSHLRPPPGYRFSGGVATTYSLDFDTTLAAAVSLALCEPESREESLDDPLALLQAAERISGKLAIFTDVGRIHASSKATPRLCSLFENTIVEVAAPNGGAFHPKIWALTFAPIDNDQSARTRLLILSRNLTNDRSWDTCLALDGNVDTGVNQDNRSLVELIGNLGRLAYRDRINPGMQGLIENISEQISRSVWDVPLPFTKVSFAVNGMSPSAWFPAACDRIGIVSPFCDEAALKKLAGLARCRADYLVGRPDQLAKISNATRKRFTHVQILGDSVETEDGEDIEPTTLSGLHAKIFVQEKGQRTLLTLGSGNATSPALTSGKNVEVFATLTGLRNKVGSIEQILGPAGLGALALDFNGPECSVDTQLVAAIEEQLENLRRQILSANFKLQCIADQDALDDSNQWRVNLTLDSPIELADGYTVRAWPVTKGDSHCVSFNKILPAQPGSRFWSMSLPDITRFVAFEIAYVGSELSAVDSQSVSFTTCLELEGAPENRLDSVMRSVIGSKEAFLRYLRLLLAADHSPALGSAFQPKTRGGLLQSLANDEAIFEELVKTFCGDRRQLDLINSTIKRLDRSPHPNQSDDPIPETFRAVWVAFSNALLSSKGRSHER